MRLKRYRPSLTDLGKEFGLNLEYYFLSVRNHPKTQWVKRTTVYLIIILWVGKLGWVQVGYSSDGYQCLCSHLMVHLGLDGLRYSHSHVDPEMLAIGGAMCLKQTRLGFFPWWQCVQEDESRDYKAL